MKIEAAATDAVEALAPYVDRVLAAIAVLCDEPGFAGAFVTDESWLSDFCIKYDEYPRLAELLGVPINPEEDWVIYRIAAKLREHERRAQS